MVSAAPERFAWRGSPRLQENAGGAVVSGRIDSRVPRLVLREPLSVQVLQDAFTAGEGWTPVFASDAEAILRGWFAIVDDVDGDDDEEDEFLAPPVVSEAANWIDALALLA